MHARRVCASTVTALQFAPRITRNTMAPYSHRVVGGQIAGFLYARAGQKYAHGILSWASRLALLLMPRQFPRAPIPEVCSYCAGHNCRTGNKLDSTEPSLHPFVAASFKSPSGSIEALVLGEKSVLDSKFALASTRKRIPLWTPLPKTNKPPTAARFFQSSPHPGRPQPQDVVRTVDADFVEKVLRAPLQVVDGRKYILIDVREPAELQALGTIPMAINVPLGELENVWNLDPQAFQQRFRRPKPTKDDVLILFCQRGRRSVEGCILLQRMFGLSCVNYEGSFTDWSGRNNSQVEGRKEDSRCNGG